MKSSKAMILAVMDAIFSNCENKPENFRTSTGFEPVTSRYRCDAIATVWPPMLEDVRPTFLSDQGLD